MPSASKELSDRWGPGPEKAIQFLEERGLHLTTGFEWVPPTKSAGEVLTIDVLSDEERSAMGYLFEEWDFGGLIGPDCSAPIPSEPDAPDEAEDAAEYVRLAAEKHVLNMANAFNKKIDELADTVQRLIAERDAALNERDMAITAKAGAYVERDDAVLAMNKAKADAVSARENARVADERLRDVLKGDPKKELLKAALVGQVVGLYRRYLASEPLEDLGAIFEACKAYDAYLKKG